MSPIARQAGWWLVVLSAFGWWVRIGIDCTMTYWGVHACEVRVLWSRYDTRTEPKLFGQQILIGDPRAADYPEGTPTYPGSDVPLPRTRGPAR